MRRLPPPTTKPSTPILFVAVIVSVAFSLALFAGIAWVAFWVAGMSEVLTIRRAVGFGVGLFLYWIVDKVLTNRTRNDATE